MSLVDLARSGAAPLPAHRDLEAAKLVALLAMALDHYGKIVDPALFEPTHAIGRLAFPLFAAIIGARLARDPALGRRYLRHLVPWALAAQPIYVVAGRSWYDPNILFTLILGVLAAMALRAAAEQPDVLTLAGVAAALVGSALVEYGPFGVAMIPAMAHAVSRLGTAGLWLAGPLGLAANAIWALPPLVPVDLMALAAGPTLALAATARWRLPRLPGQAVYAFYPAHLLGLHLWGLLAA